MDAIPELRELELGSYEQYVDSRILREMNTAAGCKWRPISYRKQQIIGSRFQWPRKLQVFYLQATRIGKITHTSRDAFSVALKTLSTNVEICVLPD